MGAIAENLTQERNVIGGVRTSPGVTGTLRFKGEWRSHCKVTATYVKTEKSLFLEKQKRL